MSAEYQDKVNRYHVWLERRPVDRPMVGLLWEVDIRPLPEFIDLVGVGNQIAPEFIQPELFLGKIEHWFERDTELITDIFQSFSPAFGIPWIEAILGCPIIAGEDSIWPVPIFESYDDSPFQIDPDNPWLAALCQLLQRMVDLSEGRFPVALPPLHSPLDILGMIGGEQRLFLGLIESPDIINRLLNNLTRIYMEIHDLLLNIIPAFCGGYVTRVKMWAPDKAITPQNEFASMISSEMYNKFALPIDKKITDYFPYHSFHLHGSASHQVESLLSLKKLTSIQVTQEHEVNGPSLESMLTTYQQILESKPLILVVPDIDTAEKCIACLPSEGLCILIIESSYKLDRTYDAWLKSKCSGKH